MKKTLMIVLHIVLFLATIASTLLVGGYTYSAALMTILLAHEMGHYIMSRRYGIPSTLPFFIPLPLPPFGTLGAIIKIRGAILNRNALFDIGAAGPLSGFLVAIPVIVAGIKLSAIVPVSSIPPSSYMELGDSLLFKILEAVLIGNVPAGHEVSLHPLAYAGWVGLFVTSLNLLPVGQLDGGHVAYAVWGERSKWVYYAVIAAMSALAATVNLGWVTLVVLLLVIGRRHPRPLDDDTLLDPLRRRLAAVVAAVFILSFIPSPFPGMTLKNLFKAGLF